MGAGQEKAEDPGPDRQIGEQAKGPGVSVNSRGHSQAEAPRIVRRSSVLPVHTRYQMIG